MAKKKPKASPRKSVQPPVKKIESTIAVQPTEMHKRDLGPAANIIKEFEGYKKKAYRDSVGVPTICWGSTKGVKMGMVCSDDQCKAMFEADFIEHMTPVQRSLKVACNDNEFGALVSLCYNIGAGAFQKSTLLKRLNAGDSRTAVADEFMKWNKAGGRVLKGLTRRRKMERDLFLKPVDATISAPV